VQVHGAPCKSGRAPDHDVPAVAQGCWLICCDMFKTPAERATATVFFHVAASRPLADPKGAVESFGRPNNRLEWGGGAPNPFRPRLPLSLRQAGKRRTTWR